MTSRFAGFSVQSMTEHVWVVGSANSIVGGRTAWVRNPSRCLPADAAYEIEGALAATDEHAVIGAAVQDTLRAAWQLTEPSVDVLCERTPRVSCIEPVQVQVLDAAGPDAERRLGITTANGAPPIQEDCRPLRRAVSALRAEGWTGAILLPGTDPELRSIVIPRAYAHSGQLMISLTGRASIPRPVVEYTLGVNRAFPRGCWQDVTTG